MNKSSVLELVLAVLDEHKANDVISLDVQKLTEIADHFVICTGRSSRHVLSLAEKLTVAMKQAGKDVVSVEGKESADWVLVDLNDVIVHIMQEDTRNFYQLEKLWGQAADKSIEASNE